MASVVSVEKTNVNKTKVKTKVNKTNVNKTNVNKTNVNKTTNVKIYKLPVNGEPSLVDLSFTYDAENPGERTQAPYNDDTYGTVVFSGFFRVTEWKTLHKENVTPSVPPNTLPGFWQDGCDDDEIHSPWEIRYHLLCDENGRLARLPMNQNLHGLVGKAYVVKQWFKSDPATEVPISIEASDIPLIQQRLRILAKTTFCSSIHAMSNAFIDLMNNEQLRRSPRYHELRRLLNEALDAYNNARRDDLTNKPYFVGDTPYQRMEQLNQFLTYFYFTISCKFGITIPVKQFTLTR